MSPKQNELLLKAQKLNNCDNYPKQQQLLSAIGDVPTCWNSSYLAWERIYNLKDAIYTALNTILRNKKDSQSKKDYNRLKKIMLQEEEWDFMLEMIGVLGPFYEFTQILGASDYVTISLVYPLINTLKKECKNTTNNVYDYKVDFEKMKINQPQDMFGLTGAIKSLLYKYLNYYWKPPTAEELLVCVLDPRTKKIKFSSQTIQEQTFTLLKYINQHYWNLLLIVKENLHWVK
ncbi:4978_t:CDS:2 [Entrophospora sp. SA101]|nr:4978_t:CDS:2 [Entrophospora sp. SA101]